MLFACVPGTAPGAGNGIESKWRPVIAPGSSCGLSGLVRLATRPDCWQGAWRIIVVRFDSSCHEDVLTQIVAGTNHHESGRRFGLGAGLNLSQSRDSFAARGLGLRLRPARGSRPRPLQGSRYVMSRLRAMIVLDDGLAGQRAQDRCYVPGCGAGAAGASAARGGAADGRARKRLEAPRTTIVLAPSKGTVSFAVFASY